VTVHGILSRAAHTATGGPLARRSGSEDRRLVPLVYQQASPLIASSSAVRGEPVTP
jgi:hypothetical protein